MRLKTGLFLGLCSLFMACSEDNSSGSVADDLSSSSASEFSPITFTNLSMEKLLSGESFKVGFSGIASIDEESNVVEDAMDSKIDSLRFDIYQVNGEKPPKLVLSKYIEEDFPLSSVSLNGAEILYEELESCGTFKVYFWAYASGNLKTVYSSVDSLEFEKESEYCEEEEVPEEIESSSSVQEECSELEMGTLVLSTMASEENRYANFEEGSVSATAEGMQVSLDLFDDFLLLKVEEEGFELGEEYGNFRAGVIPEEVCAENIEVYPGTISMELEIFQNAWVVFQSESKTYLLLIGKRTDGEGGASVEITYWK